MQKTRGFADFAGNKSPFGAFTASQTSLLKSTRPIWTLNNQNNVLEETIDTEGKEEPEHVLTQATVTAKPITNRQYQLLVNYRASGVESDVTFTFPLPSPALILACYW